MITAWTKACKTEEEKKRLTDSVLGSKIALKRLGELLTEMEEDLTSSELSIKNYDSPNWSHKQADVNGSKRTIRTIKRIINLDQE